MTVNTTTLVSNLNSKMNATTGSTDAKEFLLLGKAVEAITPSATTQSVINEGTQQVATVNTAGTTQVGLVQAEGTTQIAAVQAAGSGYAQLSGATFTGDIDMGSNNITTTGKILYSNVYSQLSDLPSASTYHGAFVHVHATGKGYYAHGGNWIPLVNEDTSGNVTLGGDLTITGGLTVNGTTTTINSTTLDVDDLNITVAKGAADAAAANGAGISVDGASANITYTSATDTWDFNKAITGTYTNLSPVVQSDTTPAGAHTMDMNKPMHHITMTGGATYFTSNKAAGKTAIMVLDTSTTPHTPLWHGSFKWANATEPTWADYRYWVISLTCLNANNILASATGHTV